MSKQNNEQYRAFEKLMGKLVTVPKAELAEKMGEYNKRKQRRKKRSKKGGE